MLYSIKVIISSNRVFEKKYVWTQILKNMLNYDIEFILEEDANVQFTKLILNNNTEISILDNFENFVNHFPPKIEFIPISDFKVSIHSYFKNIPILYNKKNSLFIDYISEKKIKINFDIPSIAYFYLVQYEEVINQKRDEYDRFSLKDSYLFKYQIHRRPIINEYAELLYSLMLYLDNSIPQRVRDFSINISHDIDFAFSYYNKNISQIFKSAVKNAINQKSLKEFYNKLLSFHKFNNGDLKQDPSNSFEWIMDEVEKVGLKSTFYFLSNAYENSIYNPDYDLTSDCIRNVLLSINKRGHKIGLHGGFPTYNCELNFQNELTNLTHNLKKINIQLENLLVRQHWLKFKSGLTHEIMNNCGISDDSTLGFVEDVGFRSGICQSYDIFSWKNKISLNMTETPLHVMEGSVFDSYGLNLGVTFKAYDVINDVKSIVKFYGGTFTILWHNTYLNSQVSKELFIETIK
ncbi:hypothetical protein GCL60_13285 [Silvanigrella paludirubra]|uniref:DUF7033 domain-containing protein n=1 Tax=Silvanigrella paludirubra TaxID=2499159 RepID=A0A6N6VQ82_9BACT|nr:hypothetical protein [Silvanigrella paludirubra]KAB8036812.1 hypothetical protein GCL60_13285 [Silvanigrella paludirubra]